MTAAVSVPLHFPVVLLPGLLCDRTVWLDQIPLLGNAVSVADYGELDSLPGMARSVLASAPPEFVVVGHSMGGRVALEIFRAARRRVKGLVLLDTGYRARDLGQAGEREKAGRMALLKIARTKGMRTMAAEWVKGMVHPRRLDDRALLGAILDMIARKTPDIYAAQIEALLNRPDGGPLLAEIDCPTLVACGREDSWSPVLQHEDIARAIGGSELRILEDCGHMSTMEQPLAMGQMLRNWISQLTRASASVSSEK